MTHNPIDGVVLGKPPLVSRLMKGIFNRRPPQPRYLLMWDVGRVLANICFLGGNKDLTLKQLSHKLVVLLDLANASITSEIHALDIRYLSKDANGVTFTIAELTKTTTRQEKGCPLSSSETGWQAVSSSNLGGVPEMYISNEDN